MLVLEISFGNVEFGTAFHAHAILLARLLQLTLQIAHLIALFKCLQFEVNALLLHLNFLFAQVAHGLLPLFTLLLNGAQEIGIFQNQNGVTLLEHRAFFAHNAVNKSAFEGIELDGRNGMYEPLGFDKFHEGRFADRSHLDVFTLDLLSARRERNNNRVNNDGNQGATAHDVPAVLRVPGAGRF